MKVKQYLIHYQNKNNSFGFYWLDNEKELIKEKEIILLSGGNIFFAGKIKNLKVFSNY
jgi:hypothetical protein